MVGFQNNFFRASSIPKNILLNLYINLKILKIQQMKEKKKKTQTPTWVPPRIYSFTVKKIEMSSVLMF